MASPEHLYYLFLDISKPDFLKNIVPKTKCSKIEKWKSQNPGSLTSAQYICMTGLCSIPRGPKRTQGESKGSGSPRGPKRTHGDRRETIKERAETHRGPKGNHGNDITSNGNALNINWERHSFTFSIIE